MTVSTKHSVKFGEEISPKEVPAKRGFSVSYQGKTLLSQIDPVAQAERLASDLPIKEKTLYFCPSPLYGYGLSVLLQRLKESQTYNSAILCVEADDELFALSQKAFADEKSISLVNETNPENLCALMRKTWGERAFNRVELVRLTGGWQLFPRLYEEMEAALNREIAVEWGNAMTLIRLGRLYARNLIRNLSFLGEPDATTGAGSPDFGVAPVLALGAGPSLDIILDELTNLSGGKIPEMDLRPYKIICADTCLKALVEREIQPDLVVILESQHWNMRAFVGLKNREIDTAPDISSLPASVRVLGGKRYFSVTHWTKLRLLERLEKEGILSKPSPPLGSVGLNTVALALRASRGPVLTGGIDFSYTMDAMHARSTPGHSDLLNRQNRFRSLLSPVPAFRDGTFTAVSKTGGQVRSDPAMRNYRNLFEREFALNSRLLDIEGPGLRLGTKTFSPAEAFAILNKSGETSPLDPLTSENRKKITSGKTADFINREMDYLSSLKNMLTGAIPSDPARIEELLDKCDYLWAHFPECAGAGGRRPPITDLGFLKRVRTEIEPFMKCWENTHAETTREE